MKSSIFVHPALALALQGCSSVPAPPPAPVGEESVNPGTNDNFLAADVDVDEYVLRFEGESREVAVLRAAIVATLELEPGMDVADVGAGTGLFLAPLANGVAPRGRVYAVDIAPKFVEHLRERAVAEDLPQVRATLCDERSVGLDDGSIDLALVCDTYHHFEYPRSTLHSIYRALRPGGRLVVVDFERIPGVSSEWLMGHVRADKQTFTNEIETAGFVFEDELDVGFEENYLIRFRRPR